MSNTTPEPPAEDGSTDPVDVSVDEGDEAADARTPAEGGPSARSASESFAPAKPVAAVSHADEAPVDEPVAARPAVPVAAEAGAAESADVPAQAEGGPSASSGSESFAPAPPVAAVIHTAEAPAAEPAPAEPAPAEPAPTDAPVSAFAHAGAAATSVLPTEPPAASNATPVYVAAPQPPKHKGNRGAGILIALLAAVVYAIVSAIAVLVIFLVNRHSAQVATHDFIQYLGTPSYYVPIVIFALAFILLIAIVNRGGWWAYVLGAFIVAVIVYFAYIGSVLLSVSAWNFTPAQVGRIVNQLWANPLTLAAAIIAREVPIWFGAWIASRGKKVRQRNLEATHAYEKEMAAGPQPIQRTS
ncbi:MAG TPA: hypothetical protein VIJ18_00880 [Microbacteriaceae bacterium]